LRHFARNIFHKANQEKPGAVFFLDKSPNSTPHVELIAKCFPEARFIHMIRDGRDVAISMLMASKGWGKSWATRRVEEAAREWKRFVVQGRKTREFTRNYTEVRYEELLSRGPDELELGYASPEEARPPRIIPFGFLVRNCIASSVRAIESVARRIMRSRKRI